MKNLFTILLFVGLVLTSFGKEVEKKELKAKDVSNNSTTIQRESTLFEAGFESGEMAPWVSNDDNSVGTFWHLSTTDAYDGDSWWMGDEALGGYRNSWYQVMDTDPVSVSGSNPTLSFYQRFSVEGPGGEPAGYDAWDGFNVQYSTDNGLNWAVLTNPTPAYTGTSLYSFGNEHGAGTGVPGWAGTNNTWHMVTFDISALNGQSVMFRFAFASDGGYATPEDGSLYGWMVDDIVVANDGGAIYTNNGDESTVTVADNVPAGADLWHVTDSSNLGSANTGTYFASSSNESGTYEPNMNNSFTSDWFYIPYEGLEQCYMDFAVRGTYSDNDEFPAVDYFGAYVQVEGEEALRYVSNVTQDPDGDNFVFSSASAEWSLFSEAYSTGIIDLSTLKGHNVRVIFNFESDDDTPIGSGLEIDDVRVWTPQDNLPVELTSFTGVQEGTKVNLAWNTVTEINNFGFDVERQINDGAWTKLAFVEGHGTFNSSLDYSYTDDINGVSADVISYRLKQLDFNGSFEYSDVVTVANITPSEYKLSQNYPNPFNPSTTISFALPTDNFVTLSVYNMLGEKVADVYNGFLVKGNHEFNFNASSLASGIYFYVVNSGAAEGSAEFTATKKMTLLK